MSTPPVALPPGEEVIRAVELMAEYNIGSVIIIDNLRPIGIFTERDLVRCIGREGKIALEQMLENCSSRNLFVLKDNDCIIEAFYLFSKFRVRHAPVVDDNGVLVGVVALRDITDRLVEEPELLLEILEASVPELSRDVIYLLIKSLQK